MRMYDPSSAAGSTSPTASDPIAPLWPLRRALRRSVASSMRSQQNTLADVNAASRVMAARAQFEYGSPPPQLLLSMEMIIFQDG